MSGFANLDPALAINPSAEQVDAFLALPADRPVTMLNLHRYRERAEYAAGCDVATNERDVSGREAYHRYLRVIEARFLPQVGARFLAIRRATFTLIGAERWDEVVVAQYPSTAAAMRLPSLPGYETIAVHRLAGLQAAITLVLDEAVQL